MPLVRHGEIGTSLQFSRWAGRQPSGLSIGADTSARLAAYVHCPGEKGNGGVWQRRPAVVA
jgi:hypothetical protein